MDSVKTLWALPTVVAVGFVVVGLLVILVAMPRFKAWSDRHDQELLKRQTQEVIDD